MQTKYYDDKNTKPIYNKFRNFKVDLRFLKDKWKEIEYSIHKYRKPLMNKAPYLFPSADRLSQELAICFSTNGNELSAAETSYLFVLGKNLYWSFLEKSFPKKEKNTDTANDNNKETGNDN